MAVSVTHTFVSAVPDEANPGEVGPDEWNAAHTVTGLGTAAELASDTDGTLAANSDVKIATQKATKTYADTKLASSSYTAADVLSKLLTVDGSGSGLDADTVDGLHVGTSGAAIPDMSQINTWTASQQFRTIAPSTDGLYDLGTTSQAWNNLHLDTGATINVENGDAVLTHSTGIWTVSTGDWRVTTAGTNSASVVTVGGTQTLTSKTLTSPQVGTQITPTSNDGAPLGITGTRFADVFLADGGVVDIGTSGSRVTITHVAASNSLAIHADPDNATASSQITLSVDGTQVAAIVPGGIEMGTGTDTTLARSGAGDISVEGNVLYRAGGTDVPVSDGGTGRSTGTTAYALIATGTTATGAQQTLAAGATTEILVGGGAAALPVWTTAQGSGAPVRATSPTLTTPVLGVATATSVAVDDLAYDATSWNGSLLVPTRNAIRDKIEAMGAGLTLVGVQVFTSGSAATYTPTSGTRWVKVTCTGGGGGGGGADTNSAANEGAAGGGEAGGTAIIWYDSTELGANATYTVGTGGGGGSGNTGGAGGAGTDGNDTTFDPAGTGATITGAGGDGGDGSVNGTGPNSAVGGVGEGTATNGDINISGGEGGYGMMFTTTLGMSGYGGSSFWGGGGSPVIRNASAGATAGRNGTAYGSGGSGAIIQDSVTGAAGGDGANGVIVVEEFG